MIEALFTIIGTILGFLLNEVSSRWREKRKRQEEEQSVRTLLAIEIDYDLKLLHEFWQELKQADKPEEDEKLREIRLARELAQSPLPSWTHRMWEGQVAYIASALNEHQIREVNAFHRRLESIAGIQRTLSDLLAEQHAYSRTTNGTLDRYGLLGPPRPFDDRAPALWSQCRRTVGETLQRGNPLAGKG